MLLWIKFQYCGFQPVEILSTCRLYRSHLWLEYNVCYLTNNFQYGVNYPLKTIALRQQCNNNFQPEEYGKKQSIIVEWEGIQIVPSVSVKMTFSNLHGV